MNINQEMPTRITALATAACAIVFFTLLAPAKAHADPIAITGGSYVLESRIRTIPPRYTSFNHDLEGANFRAAAGESDSLSQRLGSNCALLCTAGSTFSISGPLRLGRDSPQSLLELDGQRRLGFMSGFAQFDTGIVTIPLNAGSELTLSTLFTMSGTIVFQEYDAAFTGFTFTSGIFGSGIANISLFFSQTTQQYEISTVRFNFQPEPVPEPATLLLLGTGLAGIAARFSRVRRARKQE